jgi:DNA-binding NtrC family response regulator
VANFERDLINSMLEQNRFNLTKTADHLKLSRHALRYRMQRLNINLADDGEEEPAAPGKEQP